MKTEASNRTEDGRRSGDGSPSERQQAVPNSNDSQCIRRARIVALASRDPIQGVRTSPDLLPKELHRARCPHVIREAASTE